LARRVETFRLQFRLQFRRQRDCFDRWGWIPYSDRRPFASNAMLDALRQRAHSIRSPGRSLAALPLAISLVAWLLLAWLAFDMAHPLARLTMPGSHAWSAANLLAVLSMWVVMMTAMMLPSALPMLRVFDGLCVRGGEQTRRRAFLAAYLLLWGGFSAAATALQWLLQAQGWVDPMIVSRSLPLNGALLVIAGAYQFSPLKRLCLAGCRTPLGFLLGEWRPRVHGAFVMGLRHGLFCIGCCWALMALLFVGGAMNLAWIAALSIAVAIEKLVPRGELLGRVLGCALIAAGAWQLVSLVTGAA
jgi:predicted metal-binding membrane protein